MSSDSKDLRSRLLALLGQPKYQPLDKVELSKKLGVPADDRKVIRDLLDTLERQGVIARIRKERYILPDTANLVTGRIEMHRNGSAHVLSESPGVPETFIEPAQTGTAMHGDRVVAQIALGGRPHRAMRPGQREGRIIRILTRATNRIVGVLQKSPRDHYYVVSDDSRFPHNLVVRPGDAKLPQPPRAGDKVVVEMAPWENRDEPPEGEITEVLGAASDPGVDMLAIVRKYDLRPEFPAAVAQEAERIPERLTEHDLAGREDLRQQPSITIDPDDARDFDDAIHVERLPGRGRDDGGWRLSVHIADVSHYVAPETALDTEAKRRGNSTYLVDRVIPMLPERLSNGICSLKPHVDRLTFSAFVDFTSRGEIRSARFAKTVIRSVARLSYRQAFAILNGQPTMPPLPPTLTSEESRGKATLAKGPDVPVDPAVAERVKTAWELASILRRNRFQNGSLELDFPEVKIWLDENGRAVRMEKVENDISHQLIEECMLAANEVVAREIKNKLIPTVYRIHENPDTDRLNEFREFAASYGFRAGDLTQRAEVQKILSAIRGSAEEYAIKLQFLKSLKRAAYDVRPLGHYGLAKVNYTHFTSPIRRYADLLVHRALEHIVDRKVGAAPRTQSGGRKIAAAAGAGEMAELAAHISTTERSSADAERDSVMLKKIEFFQRQIASKDPQHFRAIVVDVRSYGLFVELPEIMTSGMVHVNTLPDDFYIFDAARLAFVGRKTRRRFKVGDELTVTVCRVEATKRQIDFAPVPGSEPIAASESDGPRRKRGPQPQPDSRTPGRGGRRPRNGAPKRQRTRSKRQS